MWGFYTNVNDGEMQYILLNRDRVKRLNSKSTYSKLKA